MELRFSGTLPAPYFDPWSFSFALLPLSAFPSRGAAGHRAASDLGLLQQPPPKKTLARVCKKNNYEYLVLYRDNDASLGIIIQDLL